MIIVMLVMFEMVGKDDNAAFNWEAGKIGQNHGR